MAKSRAMSPDEGFDALQGRHGNMIEMGIIDPLRVVRSVLRNGASVASAWRPRPTPWSPRSRRRGAAARR